MMEVQNLLITLVMLLLDLIMGLEFSGKKNFKATESVDFYGSLGLLKTRYDDFINSAGDNLEGREQAHAPSYQYSLGANIRLGNNVDFGLNILGKDSFYFSDSHGVQSNAYHLINANLSYSWENWKAMLWGRNLTDEDYFVRGFYFGNDPRDNYLSKGYTHAWRACTCWRYYKLGFLNYFRLFSECKKVVRTKAVLKRAIKSH